MPNSTATTVVDTAVNVTNLIGGIAKFGTNALPVARFIAGFFPGLGSVLAAIEIAAPIIQKIAIAAPIIADAIDKGRPIIDAIAATGPGMLPNFKALYAIAVNHDPARPETAMTAADVSDQDAAKFAGVVFTPGRTNEEQQQEWDRAQGQI